MLIAFVTGVLIEGFSTLIAKSFNTTKRVETTRKRLKQNNRQMLEIFYPDGLDRTEDGWRLSIRVRFVHARIRNLLLNSEFWDYDSWGMPLNPQNPDQIELFRRLDRQIIINHELVRRSALIDWTVFDDRFGELYHAGVGCPGKPTRLTMGLLYLKHLHKLSDEQLLIGWLKRYHLKGTESDSMNVMRSCAGHNPRLILKRLREISTGNFCRSVFWWIFR